LRFSFSAHLDLVRRELLFTCKWILHRNRVALWGPLSGYTSFAQCGRLAFVDFVLLCADDWVRLFWVP
jgi:hypothetical protein